MKTANAKCICEICCCGRHKCPHRPKAPMPWGPCVLSEYASQYHPHCIEPGQPIVPKSNIFSSADPMSNKTTHRNDYIPHPMEQPHRHKNAEYKAPEGRMEDATMYRDEYTPKYCPPAHPVKPLERKYCPAKFDGTATYKSDYRPWELPPIQSFKPKQERAVLPKFDGEATYRSEYVPKCAERLPSFKPEEQPRSQEPFKGDTVYRSEYVPHAVQPPEPPKPVTYARSRVPFESLTTNRKDFTPKEFCPNPSIRPLESLMCSTGPMSKSTTNRTDYKDWGPHYPEIVTAPPYKPPEGEQTFDSTYRNEYNQKPICPVSAVRPPERRRCEAKFDGTTNYQSDYTPWAMKPPESTFKPVEWTPPEVPMDDKTTNRIAYVPHECVTVPAPFKPKETCMTGGPFDDRTNYRIEYVPKEVCPCCPAGFLPTDGVSPDGYVFDHYDERGHHRYRNVATGKTITPVLKVN